MTDENVSVTDLTLCLSEYINASVEKSFIKYKNKQNKFPRNNWYNEDCKLKKRCLHEYAKMHNLNEEVHAITYGSLEKEYRRVIQKG